MPEFAVKFRNRLNTHCVNTKYPCVILRVDLEIGKVRIVLMHNNYI